MFQLIKLIYRVYQINKATYLIIPLVGDLEKSLIWMATPSPTFFNFSPANYILAGKGKSVLKFIKGIS